MRQARFVVLFLAEGQRVHHPDGLVADAAGAAKLGVEVVLAIDELELVELHLFQQLLLLLHPLRDLRLHRLISLTPQQPQRPGRARKGSATHLELRDGGEVLLARRTIHELGRHVVQLLLQLRVARLFLCSSHMVVNRHIPDGAHGLDSHNTAPHTHTRTRIREHINAPAAIPVLA